jgi:hypothetical protein
MSEPFLLRKLRVAPALHPAIDMKIPSALVALAMAVGSTAAPGDGFRAMMDDATARMHAAMHVPFTGDADRDFARMMIPHHQGAIDMAIVELRYGKDERLKRLAQEIIVSQQQEIEVMHLALGDALQPGRPAPAQVPHVHEEH